MQKVSLYVRQHGSREFVLADGKTKYPYPSTIFVLRYKQGGKRIWETLGPNHDYNLALAKAKMREADLLRGLAPYSPPPKSVATPKPAKRAGEVLMLDVAIDRYLHDVRHKAKSTVGGYKWTMMQFCKAVNNKPLSAVSKQDLNEFIGAMRDEGLTDRTIHNRTVEVITMLRHFEIEDVKVKVKYVKAKVRAYRRDELDSLLAVSDDEQRFMWQFYLTTGMREQEVANVGYDDVDFVDGLVLVRAKPNWKPKDWEEREIPIPDFLVAALKERKATATSKLIFPTKEGKRDSHMLRTLKELARKNGLNCRHCTGRLYLEEVSCTDAPVCKKWILHRFRKSYATLQARKGVDVRVIQQRLGHSSLETTVAYLAGEEARSAESRQQVNQTFGGFGKETNYLTQ